MYIRGTSLSEDENTTENTYENEISETIASLPRALSTLKVNKKFNDWRIISSSAVTFLPHKVKN